MTAEKDHHRVSEEGRLFGKLAARMADRGRQQLVAQGLNGLGLPGLRDEMCGSCACRAGTVPNGCLQTQLDLLKSVTEGRPFACHAPKDGRMCAGYAAYRAAHAAKPLPDYMLEMAAVWEYSPPDDQENGDG